MEPEKRWLAKESEPPGPDASAEELRAYIAKMSPKAKADLSRRVNRRLDEERKVWFCGDRTCDGRPHGVYNYPHARGSKREDQRGSQYPPLGADWYTWLLGAGRGAGKTRTGSQYSLYVTSKIPFIALIGPTGPAVRSVMIEGPSGLIRTCEAAGVYEKGMYEPSKARFTFQNGAVASLYTAEEPARIRGGNFGYFWADEPAHWDDPQEAWDQALFANRIGVRPHALATTTPLPSEFIKKLIAEDDTVYVGGSTYDNMDNLAASVVKKILARYEGTYLGRQEIHGEIIDDREGALWSSLQFSEEDFYFNLEDVSMDRVLVGIDPAGSNNKRSDQTGIIVGGKRGEMLHAIDDLSGKFSPSGWAQAAIGAYEKYKADAIVVERNYGGDMCRATLKAEGFKGRIIEAKATDGKRMRAEPISAKYEQHMARHRRGGKLAKLESELVSWIPGEGKSPNRLDAWVWVASALTRAGGRVDMGSSSKTLSQKLTQDNYSGPGSLARKREIKRSKPWSRV
jgi:phage terminase large subunit-like protein